MTAFAATKKRTHPSFSRFFVCSAAIIHVLLLLLVVPSFLLLGTNQRSTTAHPTTRFVLSTKDTTNARPTSKEDHGTASSPQAKKTTNPWHQQGSDKDKLCGFLVDDDDHHLVDTPGCRALCSTKCPVASTAIKVNDKRHC